MLCLRIIALEGISPRRRNPEEASLQLARKTSSTYMCTIQSSPKISHMLITRLICIQWKSSRFWSPVPTVSARNVWEHGIQIGARETKKKKRERESLALLKQARLMSEDSDMNVGISKSDMDL